MDGMSSDRPLTLPCVTCGRPVRVRGAEPTICDRCGPPAGVWQVDLGTSRERMDAAQLRARVKTGRLPGTTPVNDGGEHWVPLSSHPTFRTMFLPGHPDHVPPAGPAPFWRRWLGGPAA